MLSNMVDLLFDETLSFGITKELTSELLGIHVLASQKAHFLETLSGETREAMHRYAKISIIGSSTRIENAVLTDPEVSWLDETLCKDARTTTFLKEKKYIENKLSKQKERGIEEVAGCRKMLMIIFSQAGDLFPLSEATIKGLHRELLQYYPPAAHHLGQYKISPNSVVEVIEGTNIKKDVLRTADPGPITDTAMRDLVDWYNSAIREHPWTVAVATEFVFRFLAIHPFQDGNGRLGRALFILSLLQSRDEFLKKVVPYIAIDRHIEKNKEEYYYVLRRCSEGQFSQDTRSYKIDIFLRFMLKVLGAAIQHDVDFYEIKHTTYSTLAEAPRKVLACFREHPEERLGLKDVLKEVGIPRNTAIHALSVLVKSTFLQKSGRGPSVKYQLFF